jgi:carbon monoxide dehydrogenase subunit G
MSAAVPFLFRRTWEVAAAPEVVAEVLRDLERYPEWWPQVRAVAKIDDDTARVLCRSVLPYTLDLVLHAEERSGERLRTRISGDLTGWSAFQLSPGGAGTRLVYEQEVVVARRRLAAAARVLRPLLRWNHERMMQGCEDGLQERAATAAS